MEKNLIIDNYIITTPLIDILHILQNELTNGKLSHVELKGDNILVTCPHHKNGHESKASCNVYCGDNQEIGYGFFRCFSCNEQGSFVKFVSECLDSSEYAAKQWLTTRFGILANSNFLKLEAIEAPSKNKILDILHKSKKEVKQDYLDLQSYHPYMTKRKLSQDICTKFNVKYDPSDKTIVFPVWDESGNYLFSTKRSTETKQFYIPKDANKPVYLLNFILKENIKTVLVCESQINALYAWTLGIPAIALFGLGSSDQYDILRKCPITRYILAFDGDEAGASGMNKFIKNMPDNVFIDSLQLPIGKDLNDLSASEVYQLLENLQNQIV